MVSQRIVIMGAAGRDFHDFNVVYRDDPSVHVVAFTATQIPGIADRWYPAELAGKRYPRGIPICREEELEELIGSEQVDTVVFAYSDVSHETVMHAASRALAAGADFTLLGPHRTMIPSSKPVIAVGATRTGSGKSQTTRHLAGLVAEPASRRSSSVIRCRTAISSRSACSASRRSRTSSGTRPRSRSARSTSRTSRRAGSCTPASTTAAILRAAEEEADVILWDGGNNDFPFYRPDLFVVVADPLRPGTRDTSTPARRTSGWPTSWS
jgi:predicted GTPase